ncbi:MAG TPA: TonB-dependent receptor [Balneolaceae bacterium]|nr:TonB-dependent receptor [Balneolaceae bacterium]|tara:strand:+ start:104385 stop:106463 length:2079 start_codon:yes stop_codon:yes gene_type:complete
MIRYIYITTLFIIFTGSAFGQQPVDTLTAELDGIVVVGYEGNRDLMETPASISSINTATLTTFDQKSLTYGLNTIPGVRMEERATGSYRISIRGSSLRSPFGIRNVKVYWNDIPLTEPTGTTFLNLLDIFNMQQVEVIKGPGGSLYGAGNGGVLLINSTTPVLQDQLISKASVGSYGALNYNLAYYDALENGFMAVKYADRYTDGYRDQNFLDRRTFEVNGETEYQEGRSISVGILYSDLKYGLPGGLNQDQFESDPTQARPGNPFALGSVEANASIHHESLLMGLTHRYQITEKFSNQSSVFGTFSDFDNPFNLDYKRDSRKSGGLRSLYFYETQLGEIRSKITVGTEMQASSYVSRNYGNDAGQPDTLNFDDELKVNTRNLFTSIHLNIPGGWFVEAGVSYNTLRYQINRVFAASGYGPAGKNLKEFDPQVIPRIALAKRISEQLTLHGSISQGFSPPTIEEVRTNEGSINLDLEAEKGTNFEAGARGFTKNGLFSFDATTFYYKLSESIVQQQSERGTVLFRNAGSTDQFGAEIALKLTLFEDFDALLKKIQLNTAYTYQHFTFNEYETADGDYSGNKLTGVTPHSVVSSLQVDTSPGVYWIFSHNYTGEIPLTDGNTVYSDPYHFVQSKIGWRFQLFDKFSGELNAGIDNLFDQRFSLGYDLNAFGSRYFQPSPARNWFTGLSLTYDL